MTYNIHHAVGKDGVLDLSRIASVISAANLDIVSLQEVDKNVPRSGNVNQLNQLAQMTGMQGYFGKTRNLNGGEYGNGVLVRNGIDIVNMNNHQLPNPENVEPRAVIEMNLSIDSNPSTTEFTFFATHLMHNSSAGRIASAQFINELVSSSTTPAILAGDMNFKPGSTAFNITANEWTDATNINNSGKNRDNQIDYIFYRTEPQWNVATRSQFIVNPTTNVASDHHPLVGELELPNLPGSELVWNGEPGVSMSFTIGFATSDGKQGVGVYPANPWSSQYHTGRQTMIVGNNGVATFIGNFSGTVGLLKIGTDQAHAHIAGRNGNGSVTTGGSANLTVSDASGTAGDLFVGEGGYSGTMNWNSSGTLEVQGRLRVGQGGNGTFNQEAGVVIGGNTPGSFEFIAIGHSAGSRGVYNLNNGVLRPSGGFAGTEFRQTRIGDAGANGELNVGDDIGTVNSAALESNDDLAIGRDGGTGVMRVKSDGRVDLRTSANSADFLIGQGSTGTVIQTGGTVTSDALVRVGANSGSVGHYAISAGTLATAVDGSGTFEIGRDGATGTLRVEGTGGVSHGAELYIGNISHGSTNGRLEIIGSSASVQIGQIANAPGGTNGVRETIFWQADAGGITPLVVTGNGPLASNRVQLQNPSEMAANSGTGQNLQGDGIALQIDLSAITSGTALMLIDNRTSDPITGFFEDAATRNLYGEGAEILGTGFEGTVTITYVGGTGNDVWLNLVAAALPGDYNVDGVVDAADYVIWRKSQIHGGQGYVDWRANFRATLPGVGAHTSSSQVPEPRAWILLVIAMGVIPMSVRLGCGTERRQQEKTKVEVT